MKRERWAASSTIAGTSGSINTINAYTKNSGKKTAIVWIFFNHRIPSKPDITSASFNEGDSLVLDPNKEEHLFCRAEGFPTPTLTWMRNGKELRVGGSTGFAVNADRTTLTIEKGATR